LYRRVRLYEHYFGFALHGLRFGSTRVLWSRANKKYGGNEVNADALLKQEWNGGSGWEFCPTTITVATGFSSSALYTTSFGFRNGWRLQATLLHRQQALLDNNYFQWGGK
jgi:hypothetical protein